jgi:hypothetical protein
MADRGQARCKHANTISWRAGQCSGSTVSATSHDCAHNDSPVGRPGESLLSRTQWRQSYDVEISPRLVATIQRSPQRRIESTLPTPGTVSPRLTLQMPLGPSKIAIPFVTSRSVHPSIVVGRVSGSGVSFDRLSRLLTLGRIIAACCCIACEWSIADALDVATPTGGFARLLAGEAWCLRPSPTLAVLPVLGFEPINSPAARSRR